MSSICLFIPTTLQSLISVWLQHLPRGNEGKKKWKRGGGRRGIISCLRKDRAWFLFLSYAAENYYFLAINRLRIFLSNIWRSIVPIFFPPRTRVKKMQECAIWSICTTLMRLINAFTTIWYLYGREGLNFIGRTERQPQSPCGSCVRAQVKRQIGRSSADTDQWSKIMLIRRCPIAFFFDRSLAPVC